MVIGPRPVRVGFAHLARASMVEDGLANSIYDHGMSIHFVHRVKDREGLPRCPVFVRLLARLFAVV